MGARLQVHAEQGDHDVGVHARGPPTHGHEGDAGLRVDGKGSGLRVVGLRVEG